MKHPTTTVTPSRRIRAHLVGIERQLKVYEDTLAQACGDVFLAQISNGHIRTFIRDIRTELEGGHTYPDSSLLMAIDTADAMARNKDYGQYTVSPPVPPASIEESTT